MTGKDGSELKQYQETGLSRQETVDLYFTMNLIRTFELKAIEYFKKGDVIGNMHMYVGEEAIAAGVMKNLTAEDYVASGHRCDGHLIAKGADIKAMMAELMGKEQGLCGGRAGKMHQSAPEVGLFAANGIVGAGIPLGAGHALYASMYAPGRVAVSFFGDGGANQGVFHETVNMASLWKLPVIFICENNGYAISTRFENATSSKTVAQRGISYDIPGVRVDGNDVFDVYLATREAVARARAGEGPTLIECVTYRVRGHHEGDDQAYRSREEVQEQVEHNDPIHRLRDVLTGELHWTQEEEDELQKTVEEQVMAAVEYGQQGTPMRVETMLDNLYAANDWVEEQNQ